MKSRYDTIGFHRKTIGYSSVSTLDDVKWTGKVVEFTRDSFVEIPQLVSSDEISCSIRNRFASFGLIDNVVMKLSKSSSFQVGQWIVGCTLQKQYPHYSVEFLNSEGAIRYLRIETEEGWKTQSILKSFTWNPESSEAFLAAAIKKQDRKTAFYVTNDENEWYSMEQFFGRDTLSGFGGINGALFAAEFFLNFGSNKHQVNYEVVHHIAEPPFIAEEDSCELRVELLPNS